MNQQVARGINRHPGDLLPGCVTGAVQRNTRRRHGSEIRKSHELHGLQSGGAL